MSVTLRSASALALSLALTVGNELAGAAALGVRSRRDLEIVALAQVVTNPVAELVCLMAGWSVHASLVSAPYAAVLAAELAAWLVEALLYRYARIGRHPWLLSAALNALSFGAGVALALVGAL